MPKPRFTVRSDGIIEIEAGLPGGVLDAALNDAVTSRAPVGARHPGLSTYWIDRTDRALTLAINSGVSEPFASGNATYLRAEDGLVIAAFDFDPDESGTESVAVDAFRQLLADWRQRVTDAGGVTGQDAADLADAAAPRPIGPET